MSQYPKTLTADEAERLLSKLKPLPSDWGPNKKTVRNYTMALLMLDAGLRVGEVVKLVQQNLWFNGEPVTSLVIPAMITKTKTERIVPLTPRLRSAIEQMSKMWWTSSWPKGPQYAFYHIRHSQPITCRQVERIIRAAGEAAIGRPVHPHMLRHTFASRLMRVTNSRTVQQLLGHKQLSSTQIYTHPNADDCKTAIVKMSDNSTPE